MKSERTRWVRPSQHARRMIAIVTSSAALAACSGDVVNMGDDDEEQPPPYSRCLEESVLSGDVLVENQAQLDELEGCEVVEGSLTIAPFADADLRPLHALRAVGGLFGLSEPEPPQGWFAKTWYVFSYTDPEPDPELVALYESGWVASLEGLESLETVGGLRIAGLTAPDLEPLSNLRALTNGGYLSLSYSPNLRDLHGLRNVEGIVDLWLDGDGLERVDDLRLPPQMNSLYLKGSKLAQIAPLGVRGVVTNLSVVGTSLETSEVLSQLDWVGGELTLAENPVLTSMDALDNLKGAGSLRVNSNARLERFPAFASLEQLRGLHIDDNAVLKDLSSFHAAHSRRPIEPSPYSLEPTEGARPRYITLGGNAELETFAMPIRWNNALMILIGGNPKLRELDLGAFRKVELLSIAEHPLLEVVRHRELDTVDMLEVNGNPLLPASTFDDVRTLD